MSRPSERIEEYGPLRNQPRGAERDRARSSSEDKPHGIEAKPVREAVRIRRPVEKKDLEKHLHVKGVNFHVDENSTRHHTDRYACTEKKEVNGKTVQPTLVIRRGDFFNMTIEFDRPYEEKKHDLRFVWQLDEGEGPRRQTMTSFKLDEDYKMSYKEKRQWGARIEGHNGNFLTVVVYVPPTCPIGEWQLLVRTVVEKKGSTSLVRQYNCPDDIIILFNPWCIDDEVYMADEKLLEEYVLNDRGCVFMGSYRWISPKRWFFGQFEEGILDAVLHLFRKSFRFKVTHRMGDPVRVARNLPKVVNNTPDQDGVLIGNWSSDYSGGKSPSSWKGSVKILRSYMKNGPVSYGQCWVFSALLTTVCRTLGLPCRSVTNFASAHDTDESLTIDKFYYLDDDDVLLPGNSYDSVWNFHVWNEVWMSRPDIGPGYDGWQVIDATPQEQSDGMYCCGPSPVIAIKAGEVDKRFDSRFIFAEVNAEQVDWVMIDSDFYCIKSESKQVGKNISTHAPTGKTLDSKVKAPMNRHTERVDLTDQYKNPEGTPEERESVKKALAHSKVERHPYPPTDTGISVKLEDKKDYNVTDKFTYSMTVKNTGKEKCTISSSMSLVSLHYSGKIRDKLARKRFDRKDLNPGQEAKFTIELDGEKAIRLSANHMSLRVIASAFSTLNFMPVTDEENFSVTRPALTVQGPTECKKDETIKIKLSYTNPLGVPLTKCSLDFEGSMECVAPTVDEMSIPDIAAKAKWEFEVNMKPIEAPNRTQCEMEVSLICAELPDTEGVHTVNIKP